MSKWIFKHEIRKKWITNMSKKIILLVMTLTLVIILMSMQPQTAYAVEPTSLGNVKVGEVFEFSMNSIFNTTITGIYEVHIENLAADAMISDVNPPAEHKQDYYYSPSSSGDSSFYFLATQPGTYQFNVTCYTESGNDMTGLFQITVTSANTAPTFTGGANAGLTVSEDAAATTITTAMLQVKDAEQAATVLTYTVGTAPAKGQLKKSGTNIGNGGTFTQDDIDKGNITFTPAADQYGASNFTFSVSDNAGGTLAGQTFNISITKAADFTAEITTSEEWTKVMSEMVSGTDGEDNVYFDNLVVGNGGVASNAHVYINGNEMGFGGWAGGSTGYVPTDNVSFAASSSGTYTFDIIVDNGQQKTIAITVTGGKQDQAVITYNDVTKSYGDGSFTHAASGGSGTGAFSYTSSDTSVATINSSTGSVSILKAGTTTLTATKASDTDYNEASKSCTLTVNKANQAAITYNDVTKSYGDDSFTHTASGGSGTGAFSYTSSDTSVATINSSTGSVSILKAGTTTLTATKAGDTNYNAASKSCTLTASAETYNVTYNGNENTGGTVPTDATNYNSGATVTAASNSGNLTRTGYTFAGWNTLANGNGTSYEAGTGTFAITANTTLYAKWTAVTYNVTYNGNENTGGTVPTDATNYNSGATVTAASNSGNLTRTGYTFAGWNTLANGNGTSYEAGTGTFAITSNTTLYAKWTAVTYNVTYNGNENTGGTVPTDATNYNSGATVTAASNSGNLTRTGYSFAGWNTLANGNGTSYEAGTGTFAITANTTLYAKWFQNATCTVTFNVNGGSAVAELGNVTVGTKINAPAAPTKTGYTFGGWYKEAGLTNAWNFTADTVTANTTLFAKWVCSYELTVPSFSIENQTIAEGATKQITLTASGSKLILNGAEQPNTVIRYSFAEVEDTANLASIAGTTLTLSPPADGTGKTVKIKATASWAEAGNSVTASRIVAFTVSKQGSLPCSCIVTTPVLTVENQTIPYNEDRVINLNAAGAKLIGSCQKPGHAASQINYSYTILSGNLDSNSTTIASVNGSQLTLNPTIAGTYTITVQATASANNQTADKTVSFTVAKQPSPPAAQCSCSINAPVLANGNIAIASGASTAALDLSGQLTAGTITGGCQVAGHAAGTVNHIYTIKSGTGNNTAGASINGKTLTVTRTGKVIVTVTASANGKLSTAAEAAYDVSSADVNAVENQISALPVAGTDTPSSNDADINAASAAILAAKTSFENLPAEKKEQVSVAKRNKLDNLINRLGVLQTSVDATQAGASVTAVGLETAVNTTNDLNAGNSVNITLTVQAENNSSNASQIAADSNLIIAGAGSNQNLSTAFDVRLLKTVTETSGNITTEPVTEADAPVYVTLELPVNMRGGSDYKVYHVHTNADGTRELETIDATYNNTNPPSISFWIRKFSTIKIGYSTAPVNPPVNPPGGGSSSGGSSTTVNQPAATNGVEVLVNGKVENAGILTTAQEGTRTIATVSVDEKKLEQKLSNNSVVTIPVNTKADVIVGELNGQMVKNMETKQAVVEVRTERAAYTLPAQMINIDNVSAELGTKVELKDIKVRIEIAASQAETVKVVENSAQAGKFTIVAPAVEFNVQCIYAGKTITVNSFNSYIERTIAIPEGADPNKITTGVAVEADGAVRHVPTRVIKTGNQYYAKINSLTNSTYSVIWHPIEFKDADKHWAKTAVNDMGSRMVVSGVNQQSYEPDRDITRAEFATIIVKALGLKPGSGQGTFSDVKTGEWYNGTIQTAAKYQIISGYGNGLFGPNDKITREQAMTMIAKAMNITGLKSDLQAEDMEKLLAGFSDASQSADYAKTNIAACVKTGIVTGKNDSRVAPKDNVTRAEVAVMVQKLLQKSKLI